LPAIVNPIIPGFAPDPSIVRVGSDYYLVNSSFEWFPGVPIHHSKNLRQWRLVAHALTRTEQLDLRGLPDSAGVWAPQLSHDGRRFHMVYPLVVDRAWPTLTVRNYWTSAEDVRGPWTEPVFLQGRGWDPSLFFAADGRVWLLSHALDHRAGRVSMAGIWLQEFAPLQGKLIGQPERIIAGDRFRDSEGPHLFEHGGLYYLVLATGGTGWDHTVTVLRSSDVRGPFEADPLGPMLTSRADPELSLQRAGHGSFVETQHGEWYVAHLCSRPVMPERRSVLGRETALQRVVWSHDGWPRLEAGSVPRLSVPAPDLPDDAEPPPPARIEFRPGPLPLELCALRTAPEPSWCSLERRPGFLSLRGRDFPTSRHEQSLVARRMRALPARYQTALEVSPWHQQQMAGLLCFYDVRDFVYLRVAWSETEGRVLDLAWVEGGHYSEPLVSPRVLPREGLLHLRANVEPHAFSFEYSLDGREWHLLEHTFPTAQLSDEHGDKYGFTGAMVALGAHDPGTRELWADFAYFDAELG
jgi:xylan 1,4-beta-xylosidase